MTVWRTLYSLTFHGDELYWAIQMIYMTGARTVVIACFEGNLFKTLPGPIRLFRECMKSNPGEEPTEPFFYLKLDPPTRKEKKPEGELGD
ncbi:uncharacterized protein LOC131053765 isoform X2 [Cryptomeria japonica]|uniref:uncharacterized protein LOC131053765 isoform X2 n=1 Tax=Cryptomeria japonica TaxID=3369 RepID=UPI0025AC9AE7|nr:uncharacterized protein LOC131053765 isoform X2 [Cryptomeria japonica]